MSFKKSKLDLLVRVRYQNPLPPPPCPPKLLNIPTDPMRYARPEFLDDLANSNPLPMVVDGELGMPLDLSRWECLWTENGDDSDLNPDPNNLPRLDPKDQFLLGDPASSSTPFLNSHSASGTSTPVASMPHVAWLRKTEYLSREGTARSSLSQEVKNAVEETIDISRSAQIRDIEASFTAFDSDSLDLSALRHPTKPELTAIESFDIFPDAEIWANAYDLFRFSERPGDKPPDVEDPRLECAILRPMEADGDHFLAYYLTKEDEAALEFRRNRLTRDPNAPSEDDGTPFHFVRDYETVKVEQEVPNEFLLVFDDGGAKDEDDDFESRMEREPRRAKGAYYKNIERKMLLKRKRGNMYESYGDKWDVVRVAHTAFSQEEEDEREEALTEVNDPKYLLRHADADADGEIDDMEGVNGHEVTTVDVFGEP